MIRGPASAKFLAWMPGDTMSKSNCWVYKKCGREPGGVLALELGTCPAAIEERVHGINEGHNAGRACWHVAGTCCGGEVQGTFAAKIVSCLTNCGFYDLVRKEEGANFADAKSIFARLQKS